MGAKVDSKDRLLLQVGALAVDMSKGEMSTASNQSIQINSLTAPFVAHSLDPADEYSSHVGQPEGRKMKEKLHLLIKTSAVSQPMTGRRLQTALVLALLSFVSLSATAQQSGDWEMDANGELTAAFSRNASGAVLAYGCLKSSNTCHFFFSPDKLNCTEGSRYHLLINGGRNSIGRVSVCRRIGGSGGHEFANVIDDVAGMSKQLLAADNGTLGIARGTGNDGFTVSRFSLQGFREAFDRVNRGRSQGETRSPIGDSKL